MGKDAVKKKKSPVSTTVVSIYSPGGISSGQGTVLYQTYGRIWCEADASPTYWRNIHQNKAGVPHSYNLQ